MVETEFIGGGRERGGGDKDDGGSNGGREWGDRDGGVGGYGDGGCERFCLWWFCVRMRKIEKKRENTEDRRMGG